MPCFVRVFVIFFWAQLILNSQNLVFGQVEEDSVKKESITRKAFSEGMKLISASPKDTIVNERSIALYSEYTGKIIRHITIERVGFEKSIYDSAKNVAKTVTNLANALHTDSREKTIRQHLFIKENERLNPHKLADNERFLRQKDFILDSRILAEPVEGTDSVDITVLTRDVFSLGGSIGGSFPTAPEFRIYDANVDGRAQRMEVTTLIDAERSPAVGVSLLYRKSSILGSLFNFDLLYSQIDDGISIGEENEFSIAARASRPLVSPYSRMAGGMELSRNWSKNVYSKADTSFLTYDYKVVDSWVGYNMGINKAFENRNRQFLAFRFFDGYYVDQPNQEEYNAEIQYNNAFGYLSEFTFYRQDFFKTRYVFGFGRTEDVPYGVSLGITGGYVRLLGLERPYGAVKFKYSKANKKGDFQSLALQTGGYVRNNTLEDFVAQVEVNHFTRLFPLNRFKFRGLVSASYTQIFNQKVDRQLIIGKNEIPGFRSDSLEAEVRFGLHLEPTLFTPWSLLGFRIATFGAIDIVPVSCLTCTKANELFWGLSAGMRAANENLIFGTMEVKFTFIPKNEYGDSQFVIGFKQNLRIKDEGVFATAPSLIRYN